MSKCINYTNLLGKPFILGGRGDDGFDCVGLCMKVRELAGLPFIDVNSPEFLDLQDIENRIETGKQEFVKLDKPLPYCVVTFRMKCRYVSHIGIVLPCRTKFIHTRRHTNVVVERLSNQYWNKKIEGFYEYRT